MKHKRIAPAQIAVLEIAGFLFWGAPALHRDLEISATEDAVQCISGWVSELSLQNPSPTDAEVEQTIRNFRSAGITAVFLDQNGKPVDRFGAPFQVRREVAGHLQTVTAMSAGPDRRFGTGDDIVHTRTGELGPRKNP